MGSLREMLRRLKREAVGEYIEIPLEDGTVKRFAALEAEAAFLAMTRGEDHPMLEAARNSPSPEWANSFFSAESVDAEETEDLSES